ncbi:P-loop NTPase family protein [Ornithinibacillus californiensis]|uniref:hypothetical protein n=1 Tax=Ornithinibacillus californiensis TaxID=161536 RepID=UPI00064DF3A4|nr:hypothetical protein [Ornithinibacillus californiensis]
MKTKLILIEGLPGFGKSTTAKLVYDSLVEMNVDAELYLEGDLNHPADYDSVACFTKEEYERLLLQHGDLENTIKNHITVKDGEYLLPYGKMKYDSGIVLPDALLTSVFERDIYELPLDKNIELITKKWADFARQAFQGNKVYIFECCFIQNPVTIGMVKYNATREKVIDYVLELEEIIEKLHPTVIYVEQDDLDYSFKKAIRERPKEWYEGFVEYYTKQGFGKEQKYEGLEGTINVLRERHKLETEIFNKLNINKFKVNNSSYDMDVYKQKLLAMLQSI